jgi:hypothetical protein
MADRASGTSHKSINTPFTRFRIITGPLRVLPDFVIVGAQKCGTSSLYRYLNEHPLVAAAAGKEVHYFDWNYHRGSNWYRAHFMTAFERQLFRARSGQRLLTGEASPYYLFHPHAPRRARALIPSARLIALLRDPVERALSAYHHQARAGTESLPLLEAIEREPERIEQETARLKKDGSYRSAAHRKYSYLARGRYAEQLEAWFAEYPREQMLVIKSEDFFDDPARIVAEVFEFVGLPPSTSHRFQRFNAGDYPDMDPAVRRRLVDYFAPHNERLYALLGRDFGWQR